MPDILETFLERRVSQWTLQIQVMFDQALLKSILEQLK